MEGGSRISQRSSGIRSCGLCRGAAAAIGDGVPSERHPHSQAVGAPRLDLHGGRPESGAAPGCGRGCRRSGRAPAAARSAPSSLRARAHGPGDADTRDVLVVRARRAGATAGDAADASDSSRSPFDFSSYRYEYWRTHVTVLEVVGKCARRAHLHDACHAPRGADQRARRKNTGAGRCVNSAATAAASLRERERARGARGARAHERARARARAHERASESASARERARARARERDDEVGLPQGHRDMHQWRPLSLQGGHDGSAEGGGRLGRFQLHHQGHACSLGV